MASETNLMQTPPPLQTPISIPFQWEEAPGKPRDAAAAAAETPKPKPARSLDLPPARQGNLEDKISDLPSPTTVLDGPDLGNGVTHTLSFSFGKLSFRSPEGGMMGSSSRRHGISHTHSHRWNFSSWRWGKNEVADGGNLDFLKSEIVDEDEDEKEKGCNQFVDQVLGDSSFSSSSRKKKTTRKASLFLANIYESFKHVVPWRKKNGNLAKERA